MTLMFWHGWCEQVRVFFLASIAQRGKRTALAVLLSSDDQTRHRRTIEKRHYNMPPRLVANWTKAPVPAMMAAQTKTFLSCVQRSARAAGELSLLSMIPTQ